MKKFLLSASVAVAALCFTSCDKVKELLPSFDIELAPVPVLIQPTAVSSNEVTLGTGSAEFNINAELQKHVSSANINNVTSVKVKKVTITSASSSSTENLSNFSTARILFYTNTNTTEAQVATTSIAAEPTQQVTVTPTDSPELKSYLVGSQYTFTVKGVVRKQIASPMTVMVATTITVKP